MFDLADLATMDYIFTAAILVALLIFSVVALKISKASPSPKKSDHNPGIDLDEFRKSVMQEVDSKIEDLKIAAELAPKSESVKETILKEVDTKIAALKTELTPKKEDKK